jgi:hypothetical protein
MKRPFDKNEIPLYFGTVLQLLWPGYIAPTPDTYGKLKPTDLEGWGDDQLLLILEEGRRQLAEFNDRFDGLRVRAQWLFTTILALLVFVSGQLEHLTNRHWTFFVAWFLGAILLVVALLGSAAVFLATAQLGSVDTVKLSAENPAEDLVALLARSYPKMVVISANTCRARFTILRDALWFLVLGVLVELVTWSVPVATG